MHVRFDLDLDGESWRGTHAPRATAGEVWVGPQGLLRLLETDLGLGGQWPAASVRVAMLAAEVRRRDGFWSRSAEADPLGVAAELLRWRDSLVMAGWRGDGLGQPRLEALASLTRGLAPGLPDRLRGVVERLGARAVDITRVDVMAADAELAALWRGALARLASGGTRVCRRPLVAAVPLEASVGGRVRAASRPVRVGAGAALREAAEVAATSDLAACRSRGFTPCGDGSLQLVRPHGPLEAADEAAAWLAAQPSLEGLVVIGGDAVLDAALRRHGLPVTGAGQPLGLLQVLPLVLRVGVTPCDPRVMLELLLLPSSPVPAALARALAEALQQWPAVGSDAWEAALAGAPAEVRMLLAAGPSRAEACDADDVRARVALVQRWLRGHLDEGSEWWQAETHCGRVLEMLAPFRDECLSLVQLLRLVGEAARGLDESARPPEAGLRAVATPGAVVGPLGRVLWWGFTAEAAPALPRLPFTRAERGALQAAGVALPDPPAVAAARAERWRRPLAQAQHAVVLFCPRRGAAGDEQFPHPLWDEIVANLGDRAHRAQLEVAVPTSGRAAARVVRAARSLPAPRHDWRAPSVLLRLRDEESPSSLGRLVGCSLAWAFQYGARLKPGTSAALSDDNQLLGRLAHDLMAALFGGAAPRPTEVEAQARQWLSREAPRRAAVLFLPGHEQLREEGLAAMVEAARDFSVWLERTGAVVEAAETDLRREADGYVLAGRADMLLREGERRTVIDFKWGGEAHHRDALQAGTAYQLAAYAHAAGADDVAYYVLRARRMLRGGGPSAPAMQAAFEAAVGRRRAELAEGRLHAEGHPTLEDVPPRDASAIEQGRLVLAAPCRFCDFARLCGQGVTRG